MISILTEICLQQIADELLWVVQSSDGSADSLPMGGLYPVQLEPSYCFQYMQIFDDLISQGRHFGRHLRLARRSA